MDDQKQTTLKCVYTQYTNTRNHKNCATMALQIKKHKVELDREKSEQKINIYNNILITKDQKLDEIYIEKVDLKINSNSAHSTRNKSENQKLKAT